MKMKATANVPRENKKGLVEIEEGGDRNRKQITEEENNKLEYSPRNTKAKLAPLYSVLQPETSSDSLSEKSKGAR